MLEIRNSSLSYPAIEKYASEIRKVVDQSCVTQNVSEKLSWLVKKLGGEIITEFDPDIEQIEGGSLIINSNGNFSIFLSAYTSPLRDNFTIAHELGHYFLHCNQEFDSDSPALVFTRYGSDEMEWQANRFAAAFLMPMDKFKELYEKYNGSIPLISGLFDVSNQAAEVRAKSLGLK